MPTDQIAAFLNREYEDRSLLFGDCLELAIELFGLSTGIVSQVVGDIYTIRAVISPLKVLKAEMNFELKDTYCRRVVEDGRTIFYRAVGTIPEMQLHPVYQTLHLESYLGTPIFVGKQTWGTLNLSDLTTGKPIEALKIQLFEAMAEKLGYFLADE